MDNMYGGGQEKTTWKKREDHKDGSYTETCVEKVSNGYIKTVTNCVKKDGSWSHDVVKSIHEENPMEEKSILDKLESFLKGNN